MHLKAWQVGFFWCYNATFKYVLSDSPMGRAIKLSDELVEEATRYAKAQHRTPPRQIEHWARIGKIAEEHQDLPYKFVQSILVSIEEQEENEVTEYEFG